jgi:hypothetical protein
MMTRPFCAPGDPLPTTPPVFPYKPPANSPPRRKPQQAEPFDRVMRIRLLSAELIARDSPLLRKFRPPEDGAAS